MAIWLVWLAATLQGAVPSSAPSPSLPAINLRHLGTIKLDLRVPPASPIRSIIDFDIDGQGRLGFLRADGTRLDIVLVSSSGEILSEVSVDGLGEGTAFPKLRWVTGASWILLARQWSPSEKMKAWTIDTHRASVAPLDAFDCPATDAVATDRNGSFIAYVPLLRGSGNYRSFEGADLIALDRSGKQIWNVRYEGRNIPRLPMSASIAVTSDRTIVLLNQNNEDLVIFDRDGNYLKTISSGASWYCSPGSQEASPDVNGGIVVNDPYGSPTIRRIRFDASNVPASAPDSTSDGTRFRESMDDYRASNLKPRYSQGQGFAPLDGVRVAPDGRLWASDGESFFRLAEDGRADAVIGQNPEVLDHRSLNRCFVDLRGWTYLLNQRSGDVHVFDETGKHTRVCRPNADDFASTWFCEMSVAGDGSVCTWVAHTRYLRFGADGKRIGFDLLGLDWVNGRLHFKPDGTGLWIGHDRVCYLASANGKRLVSLRQRPDGHDLSWVEREAVAPDGSVAVISSRRLGGSDEEYAINLYSPSGQPVRTVVMPLGCAPVFCAYNGATVVTGSVGNELLFVCDVNTGRLRQWSPRPEADRTGQPFFAQEGRELWLLRAGAFTINRFEIPP